MKYVWFLVLVTLLCGCAIRNVKVVDHTGNPVEGAFVFSHANHFMFQDWIITAFVTQKNGKAKAAFFEFAGAFKPGYYPNDVKLDVGDSVFDVYLSDFDFTDRSDPIVLYPILPAEQATLNYRFYDLMSPNEDGNYIVPVDMCSGVTITLDSQDKLFTAKATDVGIYPSKQFFYLGSDAKSATDELSQEDRLIYYCQSGNSLYKVGLRLQLNDQVSIIWTLVPSLDFYIQPKVICPPQETKLSYNEVPGYPLNLYTSANFKQEIAQFKSNPDLLCPVDNLIEYVEGFIDRPDVILKE